MKLNANQRAGLHMLARGYSPKSITIEALITRGLVLGSLEKPRLSRTGQQFVETGDLPASLLTKAA